MDYKDVIIFLLVVFILIIMIMLVFSQQGNNVLKNGSNFPFKTALSLKNNTGYDLTDIQISDSLGQEYKFSGNWVKNKLIYIYLPLYNNGNHLEIYGFNATASLEFTVQMVNIDNKVQFQYLYGTPTNSFVITTSNLKSEAIQPDYIYNNTVYEVEQDCLENGDQFPISFYLFNNTTNGNVIDNTSNTNGANPALDKIVVTELYVTDSKNNTYIDAVSSTPISKENKSNSANLIASTLLFRLPKNIPVSNYIQIYMKDARQNDYNIVLHNNNGEIIITYSSNLDKSAFPILSVNTNDNKVRQCSSLMPIQEAPVPGKSEANFRASSLWPNGSTLKIGFMGGEPWMWRWMAKNITDSILPWVNLTFNFVFPENNIPVAKLDSSYQIRIAFDPNGGSNSYLGLDNLSIPADRSTLNMGWLDIPYGTTFEYPSGSGVTYQSTSTPAASTVDLKPNDVLYAVNDLQIIDTSIPFTYNIYKGFRFTVKTASPKTSTTVETLDFSFAIPKTGLVFLPPGIYDPGSTSGPLGSTILHEMCHALGQQHEHTTPFANPIIYDKQKAYAQYSGPPNNWSKEQIDGNVLGVNNINDSVGSDFDPYSIMRYKIETSLLMQPVPPSVAAWASMETFVLTDCDKFYLRKLYPGKALPSGITSLACTLANNNAPPPPLVITN
jgi:hypothetical protein